MLNNIFMPRNIFILIFFLSFSISSYANNYPNTSIGVLDLNKVLLDAKAAKDAAEDIDKIARNIENELASSDESMIKEQNKLIEAQSIMSPEAFESKRKEYEEKVQNYNIERQKKLLSIDRLVESSRNQILDQLKPILEEISDTKGITVILEKGTVLLNADTMDITDEVIKNLNKALPKIEVSLKE
tara:strand:- start:140 stop:697 length:558 start_codon:yes stop_codon:yes gene_type:complete